MMFNVEEDHPHEECGVIGVFAPKEDVARMAFFGLFALQHRGQEAAGIAVADGRTMSIYKNVGLISQVFGPHTLDGLKGYYAIGHTRYSTTGSPSIRNAQPFMVETLHGPLALGHNGNLVNSGELRQRLLEDGVGFSSSSDTEVMTMMLARAKGASWSERIQSCMKEWIGAYSLMILTRNGVYAVRDPWGFRPLCVGLLPNGGYAAASETGALHTLGCEAVREIKAGEIVSLSDNALVVHQALPPHDPLARCVFELIYFARPDHVWDRQSVHHVRQRLGEELAREMENGLHHGLTDRGGNGQENKVGDRLKQIADVIIPVPDSSIPAAIGFSRISGVPYNDGFVKNRFVGRTFIEPTDSLRKRGVGMKLNVINENVLNKRVVMIDDSIVRGNTMGPLIKLLRNAGAREVHVAITCPPIKHPCFMGVDMGNHENLIAHKRSVDEICKMVDADSLTYLSLEGMMRAVDRDGGYCQACFTGQYPIPVDVETVKTGFEKSLRQETA
ncbi:MAG TPA: amidophosphoribosyltransferase [Anaerolineales bacterium]|nr:amidophosphoribosyltransferase [Anaerolineales bacterium]